MELSEAEVEPVAVALYELDFREAGVDVLYADCADHYRERARVALTKVATVRAAELALLDKLLAAASLDHSDSEDDGGFWLSWNDGVSPDLTDDEVEIVKARLSCPIPHPPALAGPFQPHLCSGCRDNGYDWLIDREKTNHAFHDSWFMITAMEGQ